MKTSKLEICNFISSTTRSISLVAIFCMTTVFVEHVSSSPQIHHQGFKSFKQSCTSFITVVHCEGAFSDHEDYDDSEECLPITTDDCNRSLQLFCSSGQCLPNCHPAKENYDAQIGRCYRKIGADCRKTEDCELNAVCERKRCRCAKNFAVDVETWTCTRSAEFGETCSSEVICDTLADMVCRNGRCECRSPQTQFYDDKRKRCFVKLGEDCQDQPQSFQQCPENSECMRDFSSSASGNSSHGENSEDHLEEPYLGLPDDEGKAFKCKCNPGYGPTEDGKSCLGLHGSQCSSLHRCNTERNLKCLSNGVCQCARPIDQLLDIHEQRCVNMVGSICHESSSGSSCVQWAECKLDTDTGLKVCKCSSGFMASKILKICLRGHGTPCSSSKANNTNSSGNTNNNNEHFDAGTDCNGEIGLECSKVTGRCECKDPQQYYDVRMQTCADFQVISSDNKGQVKHVDTSDREYMFAGSGAGDGILMRWGLSRSYFYVLVLLWRCWLAC